jgi:hypothetical protein
MYPFHVRKVQHLQPQDHLTRLQFCQWLNRNQNLIPFILFTDEATFHRDGINNTHNAHQWSADNPFASVESNFQHRFSVNVWCGMIDDHLIGPAILENRVNGQSYLEFLQNNLFSPLLENVPLAKRMNMYFQHDGAPPHYTNQVMQFLNDNFAEKWIGRGSPINWPARSPDLTPLDFCLWGWMKSEVYKKKVNSREELIDRIYEVGNEIKEQKIILRRATQQLRRRVVRCIEVNGGIFEPSL